jgi:hypothetical protein
VAALQQMYNELNPALMDFLDQLRRFESFLSDLPSAPTWTHVLVAESSMLRYVGGPDGGVEVTRSGLRTREEFAPRFTELLHWQRAWINLTCLGVVDNTLYVSIETSSQGPREASEPPTPPDRISVNFSGPRMNVQTKELLWNGDYIKLI